ncbi:MAG: minC [Hyphomicrobiales bacterium]|nr:minC [Hyphomicrobiales bacterium]
MSARNAQAVRFRGRSFFALAISPDAPVSAWLERLDGWLERSPGFFTRNAVILDVAGLGLSRHELHDLNAELGARKIRVLGVEGAEPDWAAPDMPPFLSGGRDAKTASADPDVSPVKAVVEEPKLQPRPEPLAKIAPVPQATPARETLTIEAPVRSGQCVMNPDGDVIVVGSVSSGAEIIAAGSIHIYGALRGRAMAGAYGDGAARIFCRQLDPELIAINGLYKTADQIDEPLRKQPVQIRLVHGDMQITAF